MGGSYRSVVRLRGMGLWRKYGEAKIPRMHKMKVREGEQNSFLGWMIEVVGETSKTNSRGFLPLLMLKTWWWRVPLLWGTVIENGLSM